MNVFPKDFNGNIVFNNSPFAAKTVSDGKLFKRVHGVVESVDIGENVINFTIPYNHCKITGIEFINTSSLESASLEVHHPLLGKLNQFGFNVVMCDSMYSHISEYDADLFHGLIIKVIYNSNSSKSIGLNIILNEVKQ